MDLIQKANKLGYKHYTAFTVEELDNLPLGNSDKQIEYYFIQKWLREVHKIHIEPQYSWLLDENKKTRDDVVWWYYIYPNYPHGGRRKTFSHEIGELSTYEEALEKGLYQALKLIKNE